MSDTTWRRQCALCGALDADHAYAAPEGEPWACPRCAAIRFLWHPILRPAARGERRRIAG